MSISQNYPPNRPRIIYNVINGRQELPVSGEFSRASTGTYIDSSRTLKTAAADVPRFQYDETTGEFEGLLLEAESTNLKTYSNNPSQWTKSEVLGTLTSTLDYEDSPDGTQNATRVQASLNAGQESNSAAYGLFTFEITGVSTNDYAISIWMKNNDLTNPNPKIYFQPATADTPIGVRPTITQEWKRYTIYGTFSTSDKATWYLGVRGGSTGKTCAQDIDISVYGLQIEWDVPKGSGSSSYIPTTSTTVTRAADNFALQASTQTFNKGFSLLLDSETTTDDYLYKIKADGTTISQLENDEGTLKWDINGTSAQSADTYPQVGFTYGRIRTISSYGAAGREGTQYLYTTGLSFPTTATPAAGADEIQFGVPQTLKAMYIWEGQLDDDYAVSLIKGINNVVTNEPIKANAYSFIYNTDPNDIGNLDVELLGIVPNVNMTVDWGDGTSDVYSRGTTPTHKYPYQGQYRIQILNDAGYTGIRLGATSTEGEINVITKVEQWPPEYRPSASGSGFTGDYLLQVLNGQSTCTQIPEFKYTDLTTLQQSFSNCGNLSDYTTNWPWIPTDCSKCTSLFGAYSNLGRYATYGGTRTLPQLTTSDLLTDVRSCYGGNFVTNFYKPSDNSVTYTPWTDTSKVKYFGSSLTYYQGTQINNFDMSEALNVDSMFYAATNLTSIPAYNTGKCTSFKNTFQSCTGLTSCQMNFSNARDMTATFMDCRALVNPPVVNLPEVTVASSIYRGCNSLTNITGWSAPKNTSYVDSFRETDITVVPTFASDKATTWFRACYDCSELIEFQPHDMSLVNNMESAFSVCPKLTTLPTDGSFAFPNLRSARSAVRNCSELEDFPANAFDVTGTLDTLAFDGAFNSTKLNTTAIENILVSLETNVTNIAANTDIYLGINGANVAPRYQGSAAAGGTTLNWTAAANTAFETLLAHGWTIQYKKYYDETDTLPHTFYVMHGPNAVHFVEDESSVESGQPNQESFSSEGDAIARVLQLKNDYFPDWEIDGDYLPGERVKFRNGIYRALNASNATHILGANFPNTEVPTPMTAGTPDWVPVHFIDFLDEEESN